MSANYPVDPENDYSWGAASLPPTLPANPGASGQPVKYFGAEQNINLPAAGSGTEKDSPAADVHRGADGGGPAPDHPQKGQYWIEQATLPDLYAAEREAYRKTMEDQQAKLAIQEEKYWKELNRWTTPLVAMAIPPYGHNLQQRGAYLMGKDEQIRRDYFAKLERIPRGHYDPQTDQYFAPTPGGGTKIYQGPTGRKKPKPQLITKYGPGGVGTLAEYDEETKGVTPITEDVTLTGPADIGETPDEAPPSVTTKEPVVTHVPGPDRTKGPERTTLTVGGKAKQFWVEPGKPSVPVEGDEGRELPAKPAIKTPEQQRAWSAATKMTGDQVKAEGMTDPFEIAYRQQENYQNMLVVASGKSIEKPGEKPPDVANWKFDSARKIYYQNFPTGEGGTMVRWNWDPNAIDPKSNKRGAPVPHVGSMAAHAQKKK